MHLGTCFNLYLVNELSKNPSTKITYFVIYLVSFQAIATFSVAMTKPDVRKAVLRCTSENTELGSDDENPSSNLGNRSHRSKNSSYLRASSIQSSEHRRSSLTFMSRSYHEPSSSSDWRFLKAAGVNTFKPKSERMVEEESHEDEEFKTLSIISPSFLQDPIFIQEETQKDGDGKDSSKKDIEDNDTSCIETTDVEISRITTTMK